MFLDPKDERKLRRQFSVLDDPSERKEIAAWELDDICKEYIAHGDETASQLYDKVNEAAEALEKAVAEMRDYTRKKLALENLPPENPPS